MSWTAEVIDALCVYKRDGLDFHNAWNLALTAHPPRGRDMGEWRPTLLPEPGDEETVVEALERFADDAWHGRRPSLAHFSSAVMRDAIIDSADAGGTTGGRSRPAALSG